MSEKLGVVVDLGNSETRVSVVSDTFNIDNLTLSNNYAVLKGGYKVPAEYRNANSTIFRVDGVPYANGAIVQREFKSLAIKPNSLSYKTDQNVTKVTLNLILIQVLALLSKEKGVTIADLDVTFSLLLLLPPFEHATKASALKAKVKSINAVEVFSPFCIVKPINIAEVTIIPEGAAAFVGAMYNINGDKMEVVSQNEVFLAGDVLTIDIGEGTSDVVLIRDGDLVLESKETYTNGGSKVAAICKRSLAMQLGYFPDDKAMLSVLQTGVLEQSEPFYADDYLNQAKEEFGQGLTNFLIDYVQRHSVELRALKGLLVVGGGALPAIRDNAVVSPAMADILLKFIKSVSNNVGMMHIGNKNPRLLNILGAKIIYLFS